MLNFISREELQIFIGQQGGADAKIPILLSKVTVFIEYTGYDGFLGWLNLYGKCIDSIRYPKQ
jgi:hypothetical protein